MAATTRQYSAQRCIDGYATELRSADRDVRRTVIVGQSMGMFLVPKSTRFEPVVCECWTGRRGTPQPTFVELANASKAMGYDELEDRHDGIIAFANAHGLLTPGNQAPIETFNGAIDLLWRAEHTLTYEGPGALRFLRGPRFGLKQLADGSVVAEAASLLDLIWYDFVEVILAGRGPYICENCDRMFVAAEKSKSRYCPGAVRPCQADSHLTQGRDRRAKREAGIRAIRQEHYRLYRQRKKSNT